MPRTYIKVKLCHAGLHHWPEVNLTTVDFLAHKHRHTFYITATKQVQHDDRDIEIITFKGQIEQYLKDRYNGDFGRMSCEHIAAELVKVFELSTCEVLEDNENGAIVIQT